MVHTKRVAREICDVSAISIIDILAKPTVAIKFLAPSRIALCVRRCVAACGAYLLSGIDDSKSDALAAL